MYRTLIACLLLTAHTAFAEDTSSPAKLKRFNHQAGLQVNELFRQIFNFDGNAANTNPYLFIYTINHARTGWGLRTGVGYNYQSLTDDDGITRRTTDLNDLQARLGVEKMFSLSPKWSAGVGVDGIINHNDDFTRSVVRSFDTVTTVTSSKITSYGGGPMVWLRYHLTNSVLIGTESSLYYASGQENSEVSITRKQFVGGINQVVTTTSAVDNKRVEARLSIPVAFFLIVRF